MHIDTHTFKAPEESGLLPQPPRWICYMHGETILSISTPAAFNATAIFNSQGISGWIRFTPITTGGVQIVARLDGLTANASWSLHQLPVLTTLEPTQRSLDDNVGPIFNNFGRVTTGECSMANPTECEVGDFTSK